MDAERHAGKNAITQGSNWIIIAPPPPILLEGMHKWFIWQYG